jgi:hypothetical protein
MVLIVKFPNLKLILSKKEKKVRGMNKINGMIVI